MSPIEDARTWRARSIALLGRREFPVLVGILAMALTMSSLGVGIILDDYFHRAALSGSESFHEFTDSSWDLFRFFDGDAKRTWRKMDVGFIPWWTLPELKAAFWRPLAAATHWLDYQLWPNTPWLMHLHSILWYGVCVGVVALLFRRLLSPPWLAGLAALLFAVDDAHGMPVGFLANRNILICMTAGVGCLIAHDAWRRGGAKWAAPLAIVCLTLSLLAKEAGIATTAYLFAHALFLDRGRWPRRLWVLAPYALVVVAWRIVWSALGYGFNYSGPYVDPISEPGRFVVSVLRNFPILHLGQWLPIPAELSLFTSPAATLLMCLGGALTLTVLGYVLWPLLQSNATSRFLALGAILATVPACATFPSDRLMFFVGIGASGLVAQLLQAAFQRGMPLPTRLTRGAACGLAAVHLVVAPVALPLRAAYPAGPPSMERFYIRVPMNEAVADQTLVVMNPPSVLHAAYFLSQREFAGLPRPKRVRYLGSGLHPIDFRRVDETTVIVRPSRGFLSWKFEELFRDPSHALRVGAVIALTGVTVEITALTDDGRPAEAVFRFDESLDSPSLCWLCFEHGAFRECSPPAVGETLTLTPF